VIASVAVSHIDGRRRLLKRALRGHAAAPVTAQRLDRLITANVLRGRLRMPDEAALRKLAHILEGWRQTYQGEQFARRRRKLQDEALKALDVLSYAVLNLWLWDQRNIRDAIGEHAPSNVRRILNECASHSKEVCRAVDAIAWMPGVGHRLAESGLDRWSWLINVLPLDFVGAMQSTNPKFRPGIGHAGPLARYIAAVVPLVTGEHPSPGSVATQLKALRTRRAKKGNMA
jgi:hypothetical protein